MSHEESPRNARDAIARGAADGALATGTYMKLASDGLCGDVLALQVEEARFAARLR